MEKLLLTSYGEEELSCTQFAQKLDVVSHKNTEKIGDSESVHRLIRNKPVASNYIKVP